MTSSDSLERAAFYLTCGSAVAVLVSIAASHILLALAFSALLMSNEKLRLPPIKLPLALFLLGTVVSLALSTDPWAGRPQIRKFFVFLALLTVCSTFRGVRHVRNLVLAWAAVAALSSLWSFVQFYWKLRQVRESGREFYGYYTAERITGFMSHWMTLGGQQMMILLLIAAFVLFSAARARWRWFAVACGLTICASVVLGFTRAIMFVATPAGAVYLLWFWRRWLVALIPVLLALAIWLGPGSVRARFTSIFRPTGEIDSNQHRIVCWRTGLRMIRAHPWFGLGPELVNKDFDMYVPADIPRPLPQGWYGHLHNIYLQYAAERGVPTLLALLWLLGKMLYDFLRAVHKLPPGASDEKFVLHGAVAVIAATLVAGLFEYNLGDSEVLQVFLTVVACGYCAVENA